MDEKPHGIAGQQNHKLGDRLEDRYAGFDIARIKAGEVVGWRTELERQAAAAGDKWERYQTVSEILKAEK